MDWQHIFKVGENETVEFKSSFNNEVIETLVAFANAKGGQLFLGLSDEGAVKEIANGFLVELKYEKQKVVEKVVEKITENQASILKLIENNAHISAKEIAEIINISSRKVQENIAKLKALGILERIGAAKGGYWQIINKNDE